MPAHASRAALPLVVFFGGWLMGGSQGATNPSGSDARDATGSVAAKTTEITLPIKDNGLSLGDIVVQMATDGSIAVQKVGLLNAIKRILRPEALANLEKALPESEHLTLKQLERAGLFCAYDPENLEITVSPKVEQRPRGEISGSFRGQEVAQDDLAQRALVSGFVNMQFGVAYSRNSGEPGEVEFPAAAFDGATRLGEIVFEGEADVEVEGRAKRRGTRAIYDLPASAIRISAGDLTSAIGSSHMLPPVLGVSIEKSFKKLQPTRNVRPTGKRSFRIEKASTVEVFLNERPIRQLKLGPGEYDLDSLPLGGGANNVQLIIKDEAGNEEKLDFSILFDRELLDVGVSEWDVTAGVAARKADIITYDYAEPYASAAYRTGILESLTGSISVMADKDTVNTGASILLQTTLGLLSLDSAASASAQDFGLFGGADLEMEIDPDVAGSVHLGLEYESSGFMQPGAERTPGTSIVRASGSLSYPLGDGIASTLSAHYTFTEDSSADAFGVGLSLSRPLGDGLHMSLSGGYASEATNAGKSALFPGLSAYARLSYRLGDSSNLSLGYDAAGQRFAANAGTSGGNGVGAWSTQVEMTREPGREDEPASNSVEGALSYTGNRFQLETTHGRDFTRLNGLKSLHHSATIGTAIAFADTSVAVGRPVHGSFAVVDAHPTLKDNRLRLSPSDEGAAAYSDWLGAAIASDLSTYAPTHLFYDVEDLPPGYDAGNGSFDLIAAYKSGYRLTVGSGFTVTILGTLMDVAGKPLKLLPGVAFEKQSPERKIPIFTTSEGKLGAQGFGSGSWVIEIAGAGAPRYTFTLPPNATGMVDLGSLSPTPAIN